jgi:uncharacterized protein
MLTKSGMVMEPEIFSAINAGDAVKVRELIAQRPDAAQARNSAGVSALMQARYENKMEIVELLRNSAGELDVFEAAALGDIPRLSALLADDSGQVNARSGDGFTPLHLACFFLQPDAAEFLVRHGADANAVTPGRIGVIHSAAASRNATMLKLVLDAGANPNLQQQGGYTALHEAAMHNSPERAQALLDAGADPSIRSDDGLTAAEMATRKGNKEVLEVLK